MYRRFGLLYTIFSLLVLIAVVVLVMVRVSAIREFNLQDSQSSFIRLQGRVRVALSEDDNADLGEVVRPYAEQVPTVLAIVIYDPETGLEYVWTADIDILGFARSDLGQLRGYPSYDIREISQVKLSAPLDGLPAGRLYVDAVYRVLEYGDVYGPLRTSLIILLAFALLTVLMTLAMGLARRSRSGAAPVHAVEPGEPRERFHETGVTTPYEAERGDVRPTGSPAPDETPDPGPAPDLEEVDLEEIATDPGEPGTLFSPVSNLSFREHLEKRLGLELERSAFNDQDLTCMMVRFSDAGKSAERHAERASQILSAFKFEDLCFEYDKDTFCVILPNTELSSGIREAESFRGDHGGEMQFGLSARNGRLVEAARVLGEAQRSLEHARREPGGIVGFRPDPQKYRQYVTRTSGTAG